MRTYIADCKGFTSGEYRAESDDKAVEVWDVEADTLVAATRFATVTIGEGS